MKTERPYNLHDRTALFAKDVRILLRKIPKNIASIEDAKQLIRSSGSVGANYLEGNDSLGKKDLLFRFRISRKEAKESSYWLQLIDIGPDMLLENERIRLQKESIEILRILSSMINKIGSH